MEKKTKYAFNKCQITFTKYVIYSLDICYKSKFDTKFLILIL